MRVPNARGRLAAAVVLLLCAAQPRAADAQRLDATGRPLDATAAPSAAACVVDPASGLTWEVKTRDGGLRDMRWTYTPYDSDPETNGGFVGYRDTTSGDCVRDALPGRSCNTEAYITAINERRLCGFDDWRLPATAELMAVAAHTSSAPPGADGAMLPNIGEGWYWTGVERFGVAAFSRVVLLPPAAQPSFYDGSYLLILVRDDPAAGP